MQNSLERLFDGMVLTLRERVAPVLPDPYLEAQVMAMAELLANLSTRTEWRCADLRHAIDRIGPVLEVAAGVDQSDEDLAAARGLVAEGRSVASGRAPAPLDNAALVELRDRSLRALAGVQAWLGRSPGAELDGLRHKVDDLVVVAIDEEMARLRTGMYRRRTETDR